MKKHFLTNFTHLTFIDKIKYSLSSCNEFLFSVSFIKKAGLILILKEIEEALIRGAKGKIITSTYQNFTDIASLEVFFSLANKYSNFECHLDYSSFAEGGFHTKGYIFEFNDYYEIIIGSSNITRYALLKNIEWNISVEMKSDDKVSSDVINEFNNLWIKTSQLTRNLIDKYMLNLEYSLERWDMDFVDAYDKIVPNYMQRKALKEIRRYRDLGIDKALVIAATGSGKTYLAAFDALNFDAKRLLFIVHRDTILKEAITSFSKVFNYKITCGLYIGNCKQLDRDFIFSTNTTMSKNLDLFDKNEFDYIIIDEVHHAAADTYQKIMNYFEPQFLLGLTATPDRMDNVSVYDLFEQNVPYELRIREALENDLIVPFKYYGIKDKLIDYSEKDAKALIKQIADDIHCEFIKENIEKYRPIGKLKAIGFCRTIEHARLMAEKMYDFGYHTTYLTGNNDTRERLKAFSELQNDNDLLEIIFTVDLLNEGVDIPAANMVIFLRPTESSTIFIQQLGRGLRKCTGKEYLTVLDFIGNSYTRSVQIALALGSLSKSTIIEKKLLVSLVKEDFKSLNLPIEINIDELSKEEILNHIERTNFNSKEFLEKDYYNFKHYIKSESPLTHMDFLNNDYSPDIMRFINSKSKGKKNGCLYNFLLNIGEFVPRFNDFEISFLVYLSKLLPLVRPHEFFIIKSILNGVNDENQIINKLKEKYSNFNDEQFIHSIKYLTNTLWDDDEKNKKSKYIEISSNEINFINVSLRTKEFVDHLHDLLEYGLARYDIEFGNYEGTFKLYGNYQTEQIKMVMCESALMQVQGTIVKPDGTVYILAGLKKDATIQEHLKFNNRFINESIFQWESTTGVKLNNQQGLALINSKFAHVFVRKMDDEDGITLPYTYVGTGKLTNPRPGTKSKPTLLFDIILYQELPDFLLYDFQIKLDEY